MREIVNMYPWYELVSGKTPLAQGDFINSCPIVVPPREIKLGRFSVEANEYDVVIMSQSCDLMYEKIDLVLVCPTWTLTEFKKEYPRLRGYIEQIRRGNLPGYHLLNKCEIDGF